jgi:[ribosomal protein S5]-alanine N-acetyltransferase
VVQEKEDYTLNKQMYKQFETDRLLIRPISLTDKGFILALVNSEGWLKFIGDRNIKNTSDAEKYIQKILDNSNFFYSVFELKETNEPIGIVTFLYRDNQEFPDIGFALLPGFENKGYTFEATKAYLDKVLSKKNVSTVTGITFPENKKSIRLLERLGLIFEKNFIKNDETLSLYSLTRL